MSNDATEFVRDTGTAVDNRVSEESKLPLFPLVAFGVGSMVGAGIFGIPSQMAGVAAPGPLLIGWLITGLGMMALAFVFQSLAKTRPDVTGGVYGYAREGFGNYAGYASAWSYWISAWAGNLSYVTVLVGALAAFGPLAFLASGDTLSVPGIIVGLAVLWIIHFLILAGVRTAAFVNTVVTIVKIIPVIVFIICAIIAFDAGFFTADFWGAMTEVGDGATLGSTVSQISNMMLITVWVFIGIEGAAVFSTRAKRSSDVGKATIIAFVTVLAMLVFVNVLSYGLMAQAELAGLPDPSMAGAMEAAVGTWGRHFINIALIISVLGAMLTWVMLAAEILFVPAADNNIATAFGRMNHHASPTVSLWVTNIVSSIFFVIMVLGFSSSYTDLITIAASLILPCYVISAAFQVRQTMNGRNAVEGAGGSKGKRMTIGIVALVYTIWLLWAGGIGLLFLNGLMWLIGTPLFIKGRREKDPNGPIFTKNELIMVGVFVALTIALIVWVISFGDPIEALYWNGLY